MHMLLSALKPHKGHWLVLQSADLLAQLVVHLNQLLFACRHGVLHVDKVFCMSTRCFACCSPVPAAVCSSVICLLLFLLPALHVVCVLSFSLLAFWSVCLPVCYWSTPLHMNDPTPNAHLISLSESIATMGFATRVSQQAMCPFPQGSALSLRSSSYAG